jgi:hypothetical protein
MSKARLIRRISSLGFAAVAGIVVGVLAFRFADLAGQAAIGVGGLTSMVLCALLSFRRDEPRGMTGDFFVSGASSLYEGAASPVSASVPASGHSGMGYATGSGTLGGNPNPYGGGGILTTVDGLQG